MYQPTDTVTSSLDNVARTILRARNVIFSKDETSISVQCEASSVFDSFYAVATGTPFGLHSLHMKDNVIF